MPQQFRHISTLKNVNKWYQGKVNYNDINNNNSYYNNYLAEQYNYHVKYNNINIPVKINSVMFDISIGKKIQFA